MSAHYDPREELDKRVEEDEDNANWAHADDDYDHASDDLNSDDE